LLEREESPSYTKTGFHLTDGHREMRESATENKPPFLVRVKRWGKSLPEIIAI